MPYKKARTPSKRLAPKRRLSSKSSPRRKLQALPLAAAAFVSRYAYNKYKQNQANKVALDRKKHRYSRNQRLEMSDNIITNKPVIIGTNKPPTFSEQVASTIRPTLSFKRNYQFSAECISGRKGWFSMNINTMNTDDLQLDITSYKSAMSTDTGTSDSTIAGQALGDNAVFYVESHKESIRMVNSSSNSLTGKIHLFCHKRDTDSAYDGAGMNPINMMMYYSSNARSLNVIGAGAPGNQSEQIVGNGWTFNTAGGATGYNSTFNMPGSSINTNGSTASTDPQLSPTSAFIADRVAFWFRKISSSDFSLKPGQQFNQKYLLNLESNKIHRELQQFVHMAGISYSIVVEFQGGIVGDNTVTTGDNVISSGTAQISVIRETVRQLGLANKLKKKVVLQTAPLTTIADNRQQIINIDSGVSDVGVDIDV